jgi:hypothetical protein
MDSALPPQKELFVTIIGRVWLENYTFPTQCRG